MDIFGESETDNGSKASDRKVPQFNPSRVDVKDFERHVKVYELRTNTEPKKRGPKLCAACTPPCCL